MDQEIYRALQQAAKYIKSSDTKSARKILVEILRTNPDNDQAWYMLSFAVPIKEKQLYALEQALIVNPENVKAKARYLKIESQISRESTVSQSFSRTEEIQQGETEEIFSRTVSDQENWDVEGQDAGDLLTRRLFGNETQISVNVTPHDGEFQSKANDRLARDSLQDGIEQSDALAKPSKPKKVFGIKRNIFLIISLILIFGLLALLGFSEKVKQALYNNRPLEISVSSPMVTDLEETDIPAQTQTPTYFETRASTVPTSTRVTPTSEVAIDPFPLEELQLPGDEMSLGLTQIHDSLASSLDFQDQISTRTYLVSDSELQTLLWGFTKLQDYPYDLEKMQIVFSALGLLGPEDHLDALSLNLWADPNGTLFLPEKNAIIITGLDLSIYQSFSYAQALVQSFRNVQFGFGALGVYPPCLILTQECEVSLALVKGEANFSATLWAEDNLSSDEWSIIASNPKKYYIVPVQSPPPFMEMLLEFPYRYGSEFVNANYTSRGVGAIAELYSNPPTTTEQILHPEKYLEGESATPLDQINLSSTLPNWELTYQGGLGEWKTYLFLAYPKDPSLRTEENLARAATEGWGNDNFQIFNKTDGKALIVFGHWVWDTELDAEQFGDVLEIYAGKRVGGVDITISGFLCNESYQEISCVVTDGLDVIWILAPDTNTAEQILQKIT